IVRAMQNACDLANLERGTNLDCPLESFDEAVLDIPGNTVEYGGGSPSKQSKNFIYVLVGAGGWPVAYYTKNLEPWGDGLCIYIDDETKELSCGYLKEEDKQICQILGIPVVEDPGMCW
ncbi:MAG: hypothetical protein IJ311_06295, partial [Elusimicrobiaceae bacterium]|nr:hypothetical protein [Elusimicrobiaceae bacterium]